MRVLAIVPAHNEEESIADTIKSLKAQTWPVDEIVVVVNNSTDRTAQISRDLGVWVDDLGQISGRKAAALNEALNEYLPLLDDDDLVLSMDADTVLTETLIENGARHFINDPQLGALSSNHLVMRHGNLLELLQAMEYERDRIMIGRHKGRGGCMTGMAALFRVAALPRDQGHLRGVLRSDELDGGLEVDHRAAAYTLADAPAAGLPCVNRPSHAHARTDPPA